MASRPAVRAGKPRQTDRAEPGVLVPGKNCGGVGLARKAAVLIDAADYFLRLEDALRQAQHSILIVGWDFDGRIKLRPDDPHCPELGPFLRALVEDKPGLEIRILVWSVAVLHAPGASLPLLAGASWEEHPRIALRLDREHPLYGAHHQKIVCVDGELAFVGGIDLTVRRWDTCEHLQTQPHRVDPDGKPYGPVHDVQMAISGEAARAVCRTVGNRWQAATGERLQADCVSPGLWPQGLAPDFTDIPVAVACTSPSWNGHPAQNEIAALTADLIGAAQKSIYIEAQYFAGRLVRDLVEARLRSPAPPEIVIVAKFTSNGTFERLVMDRNRNRLLRRLQRADRHRKLRVFYPVAPDSGGECEVQVHSKVMIVDDTILRVGSANLNNRSMGLDTECDLVIEAHDAPTRGSVARLRNALLSEHLDSSAEDIARAIDRHGGSLIGAIEELNAQGHRLRRFPVTAGEGSTDSVPGTWLLDPSGPIRPLRRLRRWLGVRPG